MSKKRLLGAIVAGTILCAGDALADQPSADAQNPCIKQYTIGGSSIVVYNGGDTVPVHVLISVPAGNNGYYEAKFQGGTTQPKQPLIAGSPPVELNGVVFLQADPAAPAGINWTLKYQRLSDHCH